MNRLVPIKQAKNKKPRRLRGTNQSEILKGSRRDEVIDGQGGDDYLNGRAGDDLYLFGHVSGNDTIAEAGMGDLGCDAVLFDSDISPKDVLIQRSGREDALLLILPTSGNKLRIEGYFAVDGQGPGMIEQLKFADGTVWGFDFVFAQTLIGTVGNDVLTGSQRNDVLDGGAGDDMLDGRGGSDSYLFGRHSGNDTICEWANERNNADEVRFDKDLRPTDLKLARTCEDALVITIKETKNTLTIDGYFYRDGRHAEMIEYLKFADGITWGFDEVLAYILQGTSGSDTIIGSRHNDTVNGDTGDDYLDGRDGDDTYLFGRRSGNNIIAERSQEVGNKDSVLLDADITGEHLIVRRLGRSDTLLLTIADTGSTLRIENFFYQDGLSTSMVESVQFADGTVWDFKSVLTKTLQGTPSDDVLVGANAVDMLDGQAGNDTLDGRNGADTYIFGKGYGTDTIDEWADDEAVDQVCFSPELRIDDLEIYREGHTDTLVVKIIETGESLRLANYFTRDGQSPAMIEELRFADGTILGFDAVLKKVLKGSEQADTLIGSERADVLDGDGGNDYLDGRAGADTYLFGRKSGNDTIYESAVSVRELHEIDRVIFDGDVVIDDIDARRGANNDLLLTIIDSGNTLRIAHYFDADGTSASLIEELQFNSGLVLDFKTVMDMVNSNRPEENKAAPTCVALLSCTEPETENLHYGVSYKHLLTDPSSSAYLPHIHEQLALLCNDLAALPLAETDSAYTFYNQSVPTILSMN